MSLLFLDDQLNSKKPLQDGTIKLYPVMWCINKLCYNQLSICKATFLSDTDILGHPNSKLEIKTTFKMICPSG